MKLKLISILLFMFSLQTKAQQYYFEPIGNGLGMTGSATCGVQTLGSSSANHLLYILGNFKKADGVTYNGTCVWNGNNYDSLLNFGSVPSGTFRTASWGDTTVVTWDNSIRLMNGTQQLQFLPSTQSSFGSSGIIFSVCILNNELYIGGDFKYANSIAVNNIAKWNGTDWESVGGGITGTTPAATLIDCIGTYNNNLIVAGHFDSIGGVAAKNIARWDGIQWNDMGGADPTSTGGTYIKAMEQFNGDLYITGGLGEIGGLTCSGFAKWNGSSWFIPQNYNSCSGNSMEIYHNKLYIGGIITDTAGLAGGSLASFDGINFKVYRSYTVDAFLLFSMKVFDDYLYLGGAFQHVGDSIVANRIARFYEDSVTGLLEVPFEKEEINIYPVLNDGNFSLNITENSIKIGSVNLCLFDLSGKQIWNQYLNEENGLVSKYIHLPDWVNNGIYILEIKRLNHQTIRKIIIQKP